MNIFWNFKIKIYIKKKKLGNYDELYDQPD